MHPEELKLKDIERYIYSNSERQIADCLMIDNKVPIRSSL